MSNDNVIAQVRDLVASNERVALHTQALHGQILAVVRVHFRDAGLTPEEEHRVRQYLDRNVVFST